MMVGNNLKDTQLQQIVDKTILFHDKDNNGKINFEEFCEVVGNTDIHTKMVVEVWVLENRQLQIMNTLCCGCATPWIQIEHYDETMWTQNNEAL